MGKDHSDQGVVFVVPFVRVLGFFSQFLPVSGCAPSLLLECRSNSDLGQEGATILAALLACVALKHT